MLSKFKAKNVLKIALSAVGEMTLCTMIGVLDTLMIGQYGVTL